MSYVGVENAYVLMFCLAIIGGLTTFSGIPYHLVLITLATGGVNPIFLGLAAAIGDMIGDATSYYIGYGGSELLPTKITTILGKFYAFGMRYPKLMPLFIFVYGSVSPLSNDFIVVTAGLARYPFWKVMTPLVFGNIIFNISLAYLAIYAYPFVEKVFLVTL